MKKTFILLVTVFILFNTIVLAHSGEDEYEQHMMGGMMDMIYGGYGTGFFGFLIQILIIVALILLIYWLVQKINKKK